MATSSSLPFTIRVIQAATLGVSFTLNSASSGAFPFSLGHAFRKGEVPAGTAVAGSIPELQVIPKSTWSDGSLKFALVAGRANLTAGTPLTVTLTRTAALPAARGMSTDELKATGITAAVGAGAYGSASWSGADWSAPFMEWVSGPQMSSWIYRKPVGTDAHLVAWLEVRLFAGGAVEVLPWIENGYLNVAAPASRSATYSFTLGGSQRFSAALDVPNHTRTVLLSGSGYSYWLGAPVAVVPTHDKAYLQATGLVPSYQAVVPASSPVWARLPSSFVPFQKGGYSNAMGQAGYQPAIGILPEWDAVFLCSSDARAYAAVLFNAFSAGRFATHYRDESTQRPLKFSSYPNLLARGGTASGLSGVGSSSKNSYTPVPTGTAAPVWEIPHHPSVGYLAYLVTGRFYFLEELQFAATVNFLINPDITRQGSGGVFQTTTGSNTTRGAGWAVRTLAQAASVTPDSDVLHAEFLNSVGANVAFYYGRYVAQPNNPQGFVQPYSNYDASSGRYLEAAWMQDFVTAAFGYAQDQDLALPATTRIQLAQFFAWKAQSIVGRLGTVAPTDYLYRDAAVYTVAVAPETNPDFVNGTGPWYATWGQVYQGTLNTPNPGEEGPLRGAYFPDATSYWGNLQPAIAYAAQFDVPGARAAYARMTAASNWNQMVANFNANPVWSIRPRTL
jgi:hypothetical protein